MSRPVRVLHLEDDPRDAELIHRRLKASGPQCEIVRVADRKGFETALDRQTFDLVLCDYNLPDYDGPTALRHARAHRPELPIIVISGTVGEDEAVECLKAGATDYVLKQRPQRLGAAVSRALKEAEQRRQLRQAEEALRDSEERFRSAMHFSAIGMALVAPDGRWLEVNRALCRITGYSAEELRATNFQSITHPDDLATDLEQVRRMLAREIDSYQLEKRYIRKDGGIVWISLGVSLLWTPDGQPRHFISQIQDITQRKEQEQKIARLSRIHAVLSGINSAIVRIRERQELFAEACRIVVEHGGFSIGWIARLDEPTGRLVPVAQAGLPLDLGGGSQSLEPRAGFAPAGVAEIALREGRPAIDNDLGAGRRSADAAQYPDTLSIRRAAIELGARSVIVLPLFVEERTFGVLTLYAPERNFFDEEEVKLLTELAGDISFALAFLAKEEKVNYLAYYDALTGLANSTLLLDRLGQALRAARRERRMAALVFADLERFHVVNDTLGRSTGDACLKEVASRLRRQARAEDIVARIGADCFAVALIDVSDADEAAHLLHDRVSAFARQPIVLSGQELRLSARFGVAMYPSDGQSPETLYANAEAALKRAKSTGEPFLFYTPEMNARIAESLVLENKLRAALEKDQFVLHYQPKVTVRDRRITGFEALIRWNDPELGLVSPAKFIPLLETTGLIREVGRWALSRVARDCRLWAENGVAPPRVAVNVSAIELRQKDFLDTMIEAAQMIRDTNGLLDLEITESVIMENLDAVTGKLQTLRGLDMQIAVDDFGTGYSSLAYIARLPIHALKIDRSFTAGMTDSADSLAIVTSVISLAHSLRLQVIAEGVETPQQAAMLEELGCDQMQGYFFSRPLPPDAVGRLLAAQPPEQREARRREASTARRIRPARRGKAHRR
ncbi:MAG TPA: EAL domain-containing protein [Burkholderiales bacterium]|nr:EAL domain-containing protein [Burkholderiales bacterium]